MDMMTTTSRESAVEPFSLRDAPSLIERLWPAQKISRESEAERKSVAGQTLTGLGGYWKGRKPLLLNRACILGALLPATGDPARDLAVFEALMMIDDRGFIERSKSTRAPDYARYALKYGVFTPEQLALYFAEQDEDSYRGKTRVSTITRLARVDQDVIEDLGPRLVWAPEHQHNWRPIAARILSHVPYDKKMEASVRPEYLETVDDDPYHHIWDEVNTHLGTDAGSIPQLVEQLGIMRFGHRPKVGDAFSGSGQIPFEALRIGCDTYRASS